MTALRGYQVHVKGILQIIRRSVIVTTQCVPCPSLDGILESSMPRAHEKTFNYWYINLGTTWVSQHDFQEMKHEHSLGFYALKYTKTKGMFI
jgi:hypothetical protein